MLTLKDVENLANLSRLALSEEEQAALLKDLESILGYVSELQQAPTSSDTEAAGHVAKNVLREDANPYETGRYTEAILAGVPKRNGDYVEVKQILGGGDVA